MAIRKSRKNKPASRKRKASGLPPGSLVFTGQQHRSQVDIHLVQYNEAAIEVNHEQGVIPTPKQDIVGVDWYDIRGLHDVALIEEVGKRFEVHPLILEDVLDTGQRPKFEEYPNGFFFTFRALKFREEAGEIEIEQVALFVEKGTVISFQERDDDLFEAVRQRLGAGKGKIRRRGADYLAYALADAVADNYFAILDQIEAQIEDLEAEIIANPQTSTKAKIHSLKYATLMLRKAVGPLREAVHRFSNCEHESIAEDTQLFVRDLHDHTIQVMDMVETSRDLLNGLYDLYSSEISFKMNRVMQLLTVVTTIFIPLSFLAGVYGMNFQNMPELQWEYGYLSLWAVMLLIAGGLLVFFRSQDWL